MEWQAKHSCAAVIVMHMVTVLQSFKEKKHFVLSEDEFLRASKY